MIQKSFIVPNNTQTKPTLSQITILNTFKKSQISMPCTFKSYRNIGTKNILMLKHPTNMLHFINTSFTHLYFLKQSAMYPTKFQIFRPPFGPLEHKNLNFTFSFLSHLSQPKQDQNLSLIFSKKRVFTCSDILLPLSTR